MKTTTINKINVKTHPAPGRLYYVSSGDDPGSFKRTPVILRKRSEKRAYKFHPEMMLPEYKHFLIT